MNPDDNMPSTGRLDRNMGSPLRLGYLGDRAEYKLITELYYQDRVIEAYESSLEAGAIGGGAILGFFRMIEGEALTRKNSEVKDLTPHLKFEWPRDSQADGLGETIVAVCEQVSQRLGWKYEADALISILTPEANVPWHSARYGYMMDKYPYDKVCLPAAALEDEEHFNRVLAHEYAHVITLNLSQNRAPQWVEEGISTLIEGPLDPSVAKRFHSGESEWRQPHDLEAAFGAERRDGENREKIRDAYDQAHLLLDFLQKSQGDEGLRKFLRVFGDHSTWEEIKIQLGEEPADEALRQTFHLGQAELFQQARP
jgi:hypothetical protein